MQPDLTLENIKNALRDANGNISKAARLLNCSRTALYNHINARQTLKDTLEESREKMLDEVESVLYDKALEGEAWAVCFFLKTQGKRRGYVERAEVTGADGGPVTVFDHSAAVASLTGRST